MTQNGIWLKKGLVPYHLNASELALALKRETGTRRGVDIAIDYRVPGEWELHDDLVLHLYVVHLVHGEPEPLDHHDELRWVSPAEFVDVHWLESDVEAVRSLGEAAT